MVTISNNSSVPRTAQLQLLLGEPLPVAIEKDRSMGAWVYGRRERLVDVDGRLERASSDRVETARVVDSVRHRVRGVALEQAATYDPDAGTLSFATTELAPRSQRVVSFHVADTIASARTLEDTPFADALYASTLPLLRRPTVATERGLQWLADQLSSVGLAIIAFAFGVRVATFPINWWAAVRQQRFADATERMGPLIEVAKTGLRGAAQSERILEIYKQHGVSPMSGLLGSTGLFVQIPILLCVFNVTAESALFAGEGLWMIGDLSMPDRAIYLGFGIPIIGAYLNVLPLALGAALWLTGRLTGYDGQSARAGMLLSITMVAFFFSFASGLVLYWIVVTLMRIPEQQLLAQRTP